MSTDVEPGASVYGPVTDWATDLDHADPEYNPNAPEIWAALRESGCPVAHSERYHGMWAPITHEYVREVAYDTDHFTSRSVVVSTIDRKDMIAAAPDRQRPAHQQRPALPPARPPPAAPAVRPQADRAVGTRDPGAVPPEARRHGPGDAR